MAGKSWHLLTYDIRDPKRLRKVAQVLESYGARVQYSVFRCRLNKEQLEKLHWELNRIMEEEDDLLVIPLCHQCSRKIAEHSTGDQSDWSEPPPSFEVF